MKATSPAVDPVAVYRHVPLAEMENAFPLWKEAAAQSVEIEEEEQDGAACTADGCGVRWEDEPPGLPEGEEGARLAAGIEANRYALELIDAGIDRGRLQFPEISRPEDFTNGLEIRSELRNLAYARFLRIRQRVGEGDFDSAAQEALRLLQVGDLICNGEGIVIHYMIGVGYRRIGLSAIEFVAKHNPPESALAQLLAGVEQSLAGDDGLLASMRVDFWTTTLPTLDRVPEGLSVEQLVDHLIDTHLSAPLEMPDDEVVADAPERAAWRRRCILAALEGHPCAFDKEATLRETKQRFREAIESVMAPPLRGAFDIRGWLLRLRRVRHERRRWAQSEIWPFQLSHTCSLKYLGESEDAKSELARFAANDPRLKHYLRPITLDTIGVLRRQLRRTANPLGLWLLNHVETSDIAGSMRIQNRAYREATKAVLALCIYRARHGRLPGSLRELIKQRIIDTLPEDPHSGRALCYCPRRAAVWSIGPSGINRRGQHAHEPHLPGVVLYWAIPASGGDSN